MFRWLIHWILSAVAVMITSRVVPGFFVTGLDAALLAALVIGVLNATLGFMLKIITFPLAIATFGLFIFVINAAMIKLASEIVSGFFVYGWQPAMIGAVILSVLSLLIRFLMKEQD